MHGSTEERLDVRYGAQSSALILDVAKAASSHLELAAVLESLTVALKPIIRFHAIAVFVNEGEHVRMHSLHVEGIGRRPGESVESVFARATGSGNLPPKATMSQPASGHHIGAIAISRKPYVCTDL